MYKSRTVSTSWGPSILGALLAIGSGGAACGARARSIPTSKMEAAVSESHGWLNDMEAAVKTAQQEKKDILMFFTGSDWCTPCNLLHQEVFETAKFRNYAKDKYVLVELDFPAEKKQTEKQVAHNEKWQEKYNIDAFPTVFLMNSDLQRYAAPEDTQNKGVDAYIDMLSELRRKGNEMYNRLNAAERLQGEERAAELDAIIALREKSEFLMLADEISLMNEIIALAESGSDLQKKYDEKAKVATVSAALESHLEACYEGDETIGSEETKRRAESALIDLEELARKYPLPEGDTLLELLTIQLDCHWHAGMADVGQRKTESLVWGDKYSAAFRQKLGWRLVNTLLVSGSKSVKTKSVMALYDKVHALAPDSKLGTDMAAKRDRFLLNREEQDSGEKS